MGYKLSFDMSQIYLLTKHQRFHVDYLPTVLRLS